MLLSLSRPCWSLSGHRTNHLVYLKSLKKKEKILKITLELELNIFGLWSFLGIRFHGQQSSGHLPQLSIFSSVLSLHNYFLVADPWLWQSLNYRSYTINFSNILSCSEKASTKKSFHRACQFDKWQPLRLWFWFRNVIFDTIGSGCNLLLDLYQICIQPSFGIEVSKLFCVTVLSKCLNGWLSHNLDLVDWLLNIWCPMNYLFSVSPAGVYTDPGIVPDVRESIFLTKLDLGDRLDCKKLKCGRMCWPLLPQECCGIQPKSTHSSCGWPCCHHPL